MKHLSGKISDKLHKKLKIQLTKDDLTFQEWLENQIKDYVDWKEKEKKKQ